MDESAPTMAPVEAPPLRRQLRLLDLLLSLLFPGVAHGLAGLTREMVVWVTVLLGVTLGFAASVWLVPAWIAVHVACAIDVAMRVRRPVGVPGDRLLAMVAFGSLLVGQLAIGWLAVGTYRLPSTSMAPTLEIGDHIIVDKLSIRWHGPARGEVIVFTQPCADTPYVKRVIATAGDSVEVRCNVVYVNGAPLPATLVDAASHYTEDEEYTGRVDRPCSRYLERSGDRSYEVFHDVDRPQRDQRLAELTEGDSKDFPRPGPAPSCEDQGDGTRGDADQQLGTIVETKPGAQACEPQRHYVVPPDSVFVLGDNRANSNDSRYWGAVPIANVFGRIVGIYYNNGPDGREWSRFGGVR